MAAISFQQFISEISDLYRPPLRRQATYLKTRKVLQEFAAIEGVQSTADITPRLIARWLSSPAAQNRRAITNRSYLSAMRAATRIAAKVGWVQVSPWDIRTDWIDWAQEDEEPAQVVPRHLTALEAGRLLAQADAEADRGGWREARLQVLVYLYLFTGLRKAEALGLRVEDVDLKARTLSVRSHRRRRLKTRSSRRRVPLHRELQRLLERWIPMTASEWLIPNLRRPGPWLYGPRGAKALDQVQALARRAGIATSSIQALRRSFATHSRRWGWGELELRDLLGHSSVQTQSWYLEPDVEGTRAAIDRIHYPRPA